MTKVTLIYSLIFLLFCSSKTNSIEKRYLIYDFIPAPLSEEQMKERIRQVKEQIPDEAIQNQVIQKLKKTATQTKEIHLYFNKEKSLLEDQHIKSAFMKMGEESIHRNLDEELLVSQSYIMNKPFVVEATAPKYEIEYTKETKQIEVFQAKKAIFKQNGKQIAEVWYTEEIPYAHSPLKMYVDKGIVLEVLKSDGAKIIFKEFSSILPEKTTFERPKKGKKLSQSEFDTLKKESLKKAKRGSENTIVIGG